MTSATAGGGSRILPPHNLFGHHGPKCPTCSGLGHVLRLPHTEQDVTKFESPCHCVRPGRPAGVDRDALWDLERASLFERIDSLEARLNREARRRRAIESRITHGGKAMARQAWSETIHWLTSDGTAVHTTTDETILFPNVTLPANYMQDGRALRITASGKLSTTATPTMTWALRWGGVGGTLIATTEAITMGTVTTANWRLQGELQTRSNGATGTLLFIGTLHVHTSSTAVSTNVFSVSGWDAPATATCALNADTALSLTGDWSASSASNTITGMILIVESMN